MLVPLGGFGWKSLGRTQLGEALRGCRICGYHTETYGSGRKVLRVLIGVQFIGVSKPTTHSYCSQGPITKNHHHCRRQNHDNPCHHRGLAAREKHLGQSSKPAMANLYQPSKDLSRSRNSVLKPGNRDMSLFKRDNHANAFFQYVQLEVWGPCPAIGPCPGATTLLHHVLCINQRWRGKCSSGVIGRSSFCLSQADLASIEICQQTCQGRTVMLYALVPNTRGEKLRTLNQKLEVIGETLWTGSRVELVVLSRGKLWS